MIHTSLYNIAKNVIIPLVNNSTFPYLFILYVNIYQCHDKYCH